MKRLVQRALHGLGWHLAPYPFHSSHYLRHTARRLEHLASLGLPLDGRSVLEVGAGVGDFSHFYLDRGCRVTITDARASNVRYLCNRYPGEDVRRWDLEGPDAPEGGPWDVVHCYGVLYHTGRPDDVLDRLAAECSGLLLLETKVAPGRETGFSLTSESRRPLSMAVHGTGCRPTRSWVFAALGDRFEHVYVPLTQPRHEEFPTDWTTDSDPALPLRAVFIASRRPLESPLLVPELVDVQRAGA